MTRATKIAILVATLGLGASPAGAAWTAPQQIADTGGRYPLFAAYGAGGAPSVGVFGPLTLLPGASQVPLSVATMTQGSAVFGPAAAAPGGLGAPVAVSPGGTMIAVSGPRSPLDYFGREARRSRLGVAIGPVAGRLRPIATNALVATRTLAAAVNDRGDAAVAFSRCLDRGCAQRAVFAAFRRRGHPFARPVLLARRTGFPVAAIALNARGNAVVAWVQHRAKGSGNDIRARTRTADGTLTKVRVVGPTQPVPTIAAVLSDGGHGVVSWFSEGVGEGSVGGPLTVSAVNMSSRGETDRRGVMDIGEPARRGDVPAVPGVRLRVILDADGAATFAWTSRLDGHNVVRAARIYRDVGDVETLSPAGVDAQLMDLTGDSSGDAIAVWATVPGPQSPPGVAAVIRAAGARAFDPPQLVLTGADVSGSAAGAIASGGRAIVVGGPAPALNGNQTPVTVTQLQTR